MPFSDRIAILIPCHNEAATIAKVVAEFRAAVPAASIYVFDNASTDGSAKLAHAAGAELRHVAALGKGNTVRAMFRDVEADYYLMVDGDDTYPAAQAMQLLEAVKAGQADMVIGTRMEQHESTSFRRFHSFGNHLVRRLISGLFAASLQDVLSGYRAFSRRFVKSMPVMSRGFEIETEMTVFALAHGYMLHEVPITYGTRPEGSHSKLSTFGDGLKILKTILFLYKDLRPLRFFTSIALMCIALGIGFGSVVVGEFANTGLVTHPSTAVLAVALTLSGLLSLSTGLILDTVNRRSNELLRLLSDRWGDKPDASP
jgi:glycosyltransferase involved in cell wall biosynthesis